MALAADFYRKVRRLVVVDQKLGAIEAADTGHMELPDPMSPGAQ